MDEAERTYYKTCKESINPPHDQCLRDHHRHVPLHHPHHSLHRRRICHWVRCRFPPRIWIFQESAIFVSGRKVGLARSERRGGDNIGVRAEVDATKERALFAKGGGVEFLGSSGQEDSGIMAEDAGENLGIFFSARLIGCCII